MPPAPPPSSNTRRNARMLTYDISGATPVLVGMNMWCKLPLFPATPGATPTLTAAQSELHALNDHQFLVLGA